MRVSGMNRGPAVTKSPPPTGLERYLRHRRLYSALLLCTIIVMIGAARILTNIADTRQWNVPIAVWEVIVWESTSILMILALVPAMLVFDRYVPVSWQNWRRSLPTHLLGSMVFSALHVEGILLLRKAAYAIAGREYSFDSWLGQWTYE